jgi:hypothetical protein
MDQPDLRYEVVQCYLRARRFNDGYDADWLLRLAGKLAAIADAEDRLANSDARQRWFRGGGFEP